MFIAFVLMLFPGFMLVCINITPSVRYWAGDGGLYVVVGILVWVLLCYFLLVRKKMERATAVVAVLILPSLVIAGACQFQVWQLTAVSSALAASDCETFVQKASLESSWQAAHQFSATCIENLVEITGAGYGETKKVDDVRMCPGYGVASQKFDNDWSYLSYIEAKFTCGGWCTPSKPVWQFDAEPRDSCSVAVAHFLGTSLHDAGVQVVTYSALMVGLIGLFTVLFPKRLEF